MCYKWGHPHIASQVGATAYTILRDYQALYLHWHLLTLTTFWGRKYYFHFTCKKWGFINWIAQDNKDGGRAKAYTQGFWLQILTLFHTVCWSRPLHAWCGVVWTKSCFNSEHRVIVLLNSGHLWSCWGVVSTVAWPGLWEDYPYCDSSWLWHFRGLCFLKEMPLRKMKNLRPHFWQAFHGSGQLAVHEEWALWCRQPGSSHLLSFCSYASSVGSSHIKLLQAAYKIKTIAVP